MNKPKKTLSKRKMSTNVRAMGKKCYPVTCSNCNTISRISMTEINMSGKGETMGFICKACGKITKIIKPKTKTHKVVELER